MTTAPPSCDALLALREALLAAARGAFTTGEDSLKEDCAVLCRLLAELPAPQAKSGKARYDELAHILSALPAQPASERPERLLRALALVEALARKPSVQAASAPLLCDQSALFHSLQSLKGVGPKVADLFAERGLFTVRDLLFFLPRRYEDLRVVTRIRDLQPGTLGQGGGQIAAMTQSAGWRGKRPFEVVVQDESGSVTLSWFHYGAQAVPKRFAVGDRVRFSGKVTLFRGKKQIVHPTLRSEEELAGEDSRILVTYPEIQGLPAKRLELFLRRTVSDYVALLSDPLPAALRASQHLPDLAASIAALHLPPEGADLEVFNEAATHYHKRLVFDEFFYLQLALTRLRHGQKEQKGFAHKRLNGLATAFYKHFPFRLTAAQKRVLLEIVEDLTKERPMNRLLQGDVGSGKTIVAVLSALLVVENGRQVAFMAPTEILAEQHFRSIAPLCALAGVRVGLLTGESLRKGRGGLYDDVAKGRLQVVIGTHALIQRGLHFKDLGYVIIDEQHRFGVRQRAALREKGSQPDCLVMTATPIPRSLTLTLYGDLDVSVIDERPPGRQPIATRVLYMSQWDRLDGQLRREIEAGRQAYVVAPLIDDSEKLELESASAAYERLVAEYPQFTIGLLHGRLSAEDKERIMRAFLDGVYDILVATSVIEVGVDVPNATLMIVLHAERFGLSQLHQFRGRIGRGVHPSSCFLLCDKLGETARERLSILEQSDDGFLIAEKDLEIRGPGEFLGTRQAGAPLFKHANLLRDQDLLLAARRAAQELWKGDPGLLRAEHAAVKEELAEHWQSRLSLIGIG